MPALTTLPASADGVVTRPTPPVCSEIDVVHYSAGKPAVTVADVQAALALPDATLALGHARNLLGDTTPTIAQVQDNNAVLERLCATPDKKQ